MLLERVRLRRWRWGAVTRSWAAPTTTSALSSPPVRLASSPGGLGPPNVWIPASVSQSLHSLRALLAFSDMSQVVYARVPETLKGALDSYAQDRGVTLTSAVVDLLERGLGAASDEASVADLETKLAIASAEEAQVDSELARSQNELTTLTAFAKRSLLPIGVCPKRGCSKPIRGYDLLAVGHCPHCQHPLTDLLAPRNSSSLNERDVGVLLGALGGALMVVAAAAAIGSSK